MRKKILTHEILTKKNWDQRNTDEEIFGIHEITTRKKKFDPRNTHEKKFGTHEIPKKKIWS